ncbi:hypothetical protein [Paenibacillus sacheonensis]|uniref:Uncharacterized protein n=1 Tax=Paenibacillus sacheonensis TaxID=742054 RepID=A0A7X4YSS0_9BACL|nr:hypothetical protein [Paenibacillus sacheonensis]MBM7568187.1 hypothetical protein [Paenibacillus sacheonensis]NBC71815.1 hypothetical protein [Paenibacillus sacheonensis]
MSAYAEFVSEKQAVERLLAEGYAIAGVTEGLDGMAVRFKMPPSADEPREGRVPDVEQIVRIRNADARKYVGTLLFMAQRETPASEETG